MGEYKAESSMRIYRKREKDHVLLEEVANNCIAIDSGGRIGGVGLVVTHVLLPFEHLDMLVGKGRH